jgi:hypothetical protein
MTKTIPALLATVVLCFCACRKHDANDTPLQLSSSKNDLHLSGELDFTDSFSITANTGWYITVSPAADWLQIDKTSGNGNAMIHITNTKENSGTQKREVTVTLAAVNNSVPAVRITIDQKPYFMRLFSKLYGSDAADHIHAIAPAPDGGQIIAGYTSGSNNGDVTTATHGEDDAWVVKLNSSGAITWSKTFGGSKGDEFRSITPTADGGYILCGNTFSKDGDVSGNHGAYDAWVVKLSSTGAVQWSKTLGGSEYDFAYSIIQTTDGGYLMAGYTDSNDYDVSGNHGSADIWAVKLNSTGVIQWTKTLGGKNWDGIVMNQCIVNTSDGGYLLAGITNSNDGDIRDNHGNDDAWIIKLGNTGDLLWQKTVGSEGFDGAYAITGTTEGGAILVGYTGTTNNVDGFIVKINNTGTPQWSKTVGGTNNEELLTIVANPDGSCVTAGYTDSNNGDATGNSGNRNGWLLKLNNKGEKIWHKTPGGSDSEYISSIFRTVDGKYIFVGYSASNDGDVSGQHGSSDAWLLKFE